MPSYTYQEVLNYAQHLTPDEQLRLMEELAAIVRQRVTVEQTPSESVHSIMELKGLGKEIWNGIDAQKYVDEERNSWDG